MITQLSHRFVGSGVAAGAGLAVVWLVAAVLRPESTFHLAPILIAGAVPFTQRRQGRDRVGTAVTSGLTLAAAAAVLLATLDLLRGPSVLPLGDALVEALVFAPLGAFVGLTVAVLISGTE
jgi:hypothetical protein